MDHTPYAVACVKGNNGLRGKVEFIPHCRGVLVVADVSGLPDSQTGFFGFHIHEGADCGAAGYANTAGHYNPNNTNHPEHAGDLPPLLSCNGRAFLAVVTDRFRLSDVMGRTVVIHSQPDDYTTQPSGNAGEKIACGVIRRA